MGSLLAGGNKKAKANQNIRGEWDFCLKLLCVPTQKHSPSYLRHTLTLNVRQKITNIQFIYHLV